MLSTGEPRTDATPTVWSIHPPEITASLFAYLDSFGLVFGAFDFAVTDHGEWIFLECNPSGQWAWLEDETGLPMVAAFADLLERKGA